MDIRIGKPLCFSEIGRKPNQEDALFPLEGNADSSTRVFMVCDGMGGHEHGEVASQCVAATIGNFTSNVGDTTAEEMKLLFANGLAKAYKALDELDTEETQKKMGTTLTFLALCSDGVFTAHIGDSRIYQLRPGVGIIYQTIDHSLVSDLVSIGEITPEQARTHPQRNIITRAVMPHQDFPSKATVKTLTDVRPGDLFFLCSDGVIEENTDDHLEKILLGEGTIEDRLSILRENCALCNTRDNYTCYLIEIESCNPMGAAVPVEVPEEEEGDEAYIPMTPEEIAAYEKSVNSNNNTDTDMNEETPKNGLSERDNKIIVSVLAGIIAIGLLYMFFFNGQSEKYRDPDANAASSLNDSLNFGLDDMDSVAVMQGLPESEKKDKDDEKDKEEVTTTTTATTTTADPAATTTTTEAAPVTPAPSEPAQEPVVKKVKTKKVVEDIKTGPSQEATISE